MDSLEFFTNVDFFKFLLQDFFLLSTDKEFFPKYFCLFHENQHGLKKTKFLFFFNILNQKSFKDFFQAAKWIFSGLILQNKQWNFEHFFANFVFFFQFSRKAFLKDNFFLKHEDFFLKIFFSQGLTGQLGFCRNI